MAGGICPEAGLEIANGSYKVLSSGQLIYHCDKGNLHLFVFHVHVHINPALCGRSRGRVEKAGLYIALKNSMGDRLKKYEKMQSVRLYVLYM